MRPTTDRLRRTMLVTAFLLLPACRSQVPQNEPPAERTERPRPPKA